MVRTTSPGEVRLAYETARKKYKTLPKYDDINNEFEIVRVEFVEFIVQEVRRHLMRALNTCANDYQAVLSPHPQDPHSMLESNAFSKEEKQKIYKNYKEIWYLIHEGILKGYGTERDSANYITSVWKAWPKIKKTYLTTVQKIAREWKKEAAKQKEDKGYLG